ncbi:hypothetical protein EJ02DRAFT_398025 [Clathrospora elynae]|uniref:TEA domain-containing protein n=1 Tax=Clathrospora elynae TaxID=706981 RepID=A0A6A5SY74_9PLEO|nr:hypothetical protein EJ02DRAFT_398025 [Clathrospora elynae]
MELQHHLPYELAADASSSQHRGVLRERSANRRHEHHNITSTPLLKQSRSSSPTENVYAQRVVPVGSYFAGNVHAQHVGLAGFGVERPEEQIRYELERLYKMLQRSDKYQKYREKQPVLTPNEVIAREAAEKQERGRKERERREKGMRAHDKPEKDKTVWPEFLEHAFWRALVRWPPMGRKKYMLDSALRGRNELIQDSIYRDTGISRDRKQVSSHLQVLKAHLKDNPAVLVYMATREGDKTQHRGAASSHAYHLSHMRGPQSSQPTGYVPKYDFTTSTPQHFWPQFGGLPLPGLTLGAGLDSNAASLPFEVSDFIMHVDGDHQPVHYFTQLQSNGRTQDLNVTDTDSWRRQYPEFDFLRSQMDEWRTKDRKVLVCDASIKVMTEARPNAQLSTIIYLHSHHDLSLFESLECTTRFYDSGDNTPDPQFDSVKQDLKEHRTPCVYEPDSEGSAPRLRIAFGSQFWVVRMAKYQSLRHNDERYVRDSLLNLTATQDIYGIESGTGKTQCLFTILWRFRQTRNPTEVGSMSWRAVNFANRQTAAEQEWIHKEEYMASKTVDVKCSYNDAIDGSTTTPDDLPLYPQPSQLPLGFQHAHQTHHAYELQPHHEHQNPPPLSLGILASMQPDLKHTSASAPTTATDYSQQSFALSNSHSQDTVRSLLHAYDNDFDFNGGHMTIASAFEPAMNLSAYSSFATQSTGLDGLHALSGLEGHGFSGLGLAVGEHGQFVAVGSGAEMQDAAATADDVACYSTKPNWRYANLISQLENAAESHCYMEAHDGGLEHDHVRAHDDQAAHGQEVLHGHKVVYQQVSKAEEELVARGLHDEHVNVGHGHGLWNLASSFQEDTASSATGADCRKEQAHGLGFRGLDLIERDQRARGY